MILKGTAFRPSAIVQDGRKPERKVLIQFDRGPRQVPHLDLLGWLIFIEGMGVLERADLLQQRMQRRQWPPECPPLASPENRQGSFRSCRRVARPSNLRVPHPSRFCLGGDFRSRLENYLERRRRTGRLGADVRRLTFEPTSISECSALFTAAEFGNTAAISGSSTTTFELSFTRS